MRELYVEGDSLLHRLSASVKLGGLICFSILIFFTDRISLLAVPLLLAGMTYFALPMPLKTALRRLLPIALAILFVGLLTWIFNSAFQALVTVMRLVALMLAAAAITASTPVSAFMETVTRWARPLEKTGLVNAADIGLAVGLVIRFVPDILSRYEALRDAHRARGLRMKPLSTLIPLVILTLRDADKIADAIDARGIRSRARERTPE